MSRFSNITFLSDFGSTDETVGVCRSILREIVPDTGVIDLAHEIPLGDVRLAGLMLARSVPYLAPGLVVACVGASMGRPDIAVEVGEGQAVLVGPDNGVLAPAVAVVGGADRAVRLTNAEFQLSAPGRVHRGRDVLVPCAGHLAAGAPLEAMGELVDPAVLVPSLVPVPRPEDDGSIAAEVLFVDRSGAVQLNVDRDTVRDLGDVVVLTFKEERRVVRVVDSVDDINPGQYALTDDHHGLLAVTAGRGSAAADLGLQVGTEVNVSEAT